MHACVCVCVSLEAEEAQQQTRVERKATSPSTHGPRELVPGEMDGFMVGCGPVGDTAGVGSC